MEVFNQIYAQNVWSTDGDGSGGGSEPANTVALRAVLTRLVRENSIKSFIDAPCGACKWTRVWLEELAALGIRLKYIGIDISEIALERAQKNLAGLEHDIELRRADISTVRLDACDAILCRDTLQHLSLQDGVRAVQNLLTSNCRMVLLGGYLVDQPNTNITTGGCYAINYTKPPFNLAPVAIYRELHCGREPTKYLFEFASA